jgi:signal transduction histidine kinase
MRPRLNLPFKIRGAWISADANLQNRDDGSGIVSERLKTREGFGFTNMRERAKKLNGTLEIRTAPGRGTSIVVSLPVN